MIHAALPAFSLRKFLLCVLLALMLAGCGQQDSATFAPLPRDAVVLVIGDSLVAGTGAPSGAGWPEALAQRTGWQVVNGGVPGDTSADALRRLDGLIAEYRPQAIVIAIGGNDFLRNVPLDATRANIEHMIRDSRAASTHVGLVAIPAKSVGAALIGNLSDHAVFAELAQAHELALVPEVIADVLSRDELRADRIHANASGYAQIADGVAEALRRQGWLVR
ncbi:MAG: GDSL-type esterase/lipase family protein [Pseudazoarcus pumilus]|nr:GDSL-type esterase/lipase family protein [Pseudazoarcus pumilus]